MNRNPDCGQAFGVAAPASFEPSGLSGPDRWTAAAADLTAIRPLPPATPGQRLDDADADRARTSQPLPPEARGILIAAILRILMDLATPARPLVSAVNALIALERHQLSGRLGPPALLADEVRAALMSTLARVLADHANPARLVVSAANSLLALERNRLRAERHQSASSSDQSVLNPQPPPSTPATRSPPNPPSPRTVSAARSVTPKDAGENDEPSQNAAAGSGPVSGSAERPERSGSVIQGPGNSTESWRATSAGLSVERDHAAGIPGHDESDRLRPSIESDRLPGRDDEHHRRERAAAAERHRRRQLRNGLRTT